MLPFFIRIIRRSSMNADDTKLVILLFALAFITIGGLLTVGFHIEKNKQECITTAINKGLPTLEIMQLCK